MTFINSANMLNMGADAVKPAQNNVQSQEPQTNQPDEFAKALRKQMQQANKSANNAASAAEAQSKQALNDSLRTQPQQQPVNTIKDKSKADAAKSENDNSTQASSEDAQVDDKTAKTEDASDVKETAEDRKKRLSADDKNTDSTATGLTPWMQTMMAMRPNASQSVAKDATTASDADAALPQGDLLANPTATSATENPAGKTLATTDLAADAEPVVGKDSKGIDFKQMLGEDQKNSQLGKTGDFTETLSIAKSVAEAVQGAVKADKGGSELAKFDLQAADAANITSTLPASQALPNSSWTNAAGVSQSNVLMSQIATPFGNDRWQTAMNQHVMNMVGSGDDVASLTLSPPDLGPIQVVLKVDNQSVNTSFITDNPAVRQALEDGMQDLRDRMQSQGLELGQTFVGNGQQAQQHFEQEASNGGGRSSGNSNTEDSSAVTPTAVKTTVVRGLVDTFV
jgi:flagellar hook-length control protein FliK